jgi:hypothetical protein
MPSSFQSGASPTHSLEVRLKDKKPILLSYASMRDIEYTADKIRINGDDYAVYIKGANLGPLIEALGKETAQWIGVGRSAESTEIEAIEMDGTFVEGLIEGLKDGFLRPIRWAGTALGDLIK